MGPVWIMGLKGDIHLITDCYVRENGSVNRLYVESVNGNAHLLLAEGDPKFPVGTYLKGDLEKRRDGILEYIEKHNGDVFKVV